jgi:hypothetical protein
MAYQPDSQSVSDLLRAEFPELARLTVVARAAHTQTLIRKHVLERVCLSLERIAEHRREAARER